MSILDRNPVERRNELPFPKGIIGGRAADAILNRIRYVDFGAGSTKYAPEGNAGKGKLEIIFGSEIWSRTRDRIVLDWGCGCGTECLEVAPHARQVIGYDIDPLKIQAAEISARSARISNAKFITVISSGLKADVILSLDAFEHIQDLAAALRTMHATLSGSRGSRVIFSFGPIWFHPYGSHITPFPWSHLVLTEDALVRWRNNAKNDKVASFSDGAGGTNQMTIRKFEEIIENSPFSNAQIDYVPIRKLRWFHNRITREFTTAIIRGELTK